MRKILSFTPALLAPSRAEALGAQGVPETAETPERFDRLFREGLDLYHRTAAPAGVLEEIAGEEFGSIFEGEGRNEPDAPLASIFPSAVRLALFSATLGEAISEKVASLFRSNDPALASMLDAIASSAADAVASRMEERYLSYLAAEGAAGPGTKTLAYSPGYCGWDVSGQRRLFDRLKPEAIGITLGVTFLMRPIKSVSGVLVSGPAAIHRFEPDYPFCRDCRTRTCRARMEETWRS
jgi:hypothetical protein